MIGCSHLISHFIALVIDVHHALVEYLYGALNHRQENFLEGDISWYCGLNFDQIHYIRA